MNSKDNATKKQKNKKRRNPFRYWPFYFIKITGALTVLMWLRPKRLYESKKAKKHVRGRAVAIANHSSYIDPVALYTALWYRRVHILTMQELFTKKIGNLFFRSALCIPVNRSGFNMETFRKSIEVLEEGDVLGIFPEGGINHDSTVNSFKSGAALMALKGRAPIIPIYIIPPKKWFNRIVIVTGEPINPVEICGETPNLRGIDELSQKLREKEITLMEIYSKWKKTKS